MNLAFKVALNVSNFVLLPHFWNMVFKLTVLLFKILKILDVFFEVKYCVPYIFIIMYLMKEVHVYAYIELMGVYIFQIL